MDSKDNNRKTVAVLFGGRSVEHEISVITALQLLKAIDSATYDVLPVYIAPSGRWFVGDELRDRAFYRQGPAALRALTEVTLLPVPDVQGLTVLSPSRSFLQGALAGAVINVDVFFLAFHGEYGEDGCVQGLMELADIAYTGGGVLSSALAMDKHLCKSVLRDHGIPTLPDVIIRKEDALTDFSACMTSLFASDVFSSFPVFVKPCHLGSSVGISLATDEDSFRKALALVFRHDDAAIIEPYLDNMMEINVSVVEGREPIVSVVEIPVRDGGFLSYEDKYLRESGSKKTGEENSGMASLTRDIDPEHLDVDLKRQVQDYALRAVRVLDCSGIVRFDFMYDLQTESLYFNELNPMPGSFAFYLWAESKPRRLYTDIITLAIERAIERKGIQKSLVKELELRALAQ